MASTLSSPFPFLLPKLGLCNCTLYSDLLLLAAVFAFYLFPGGLSWASAKRRSQAAILGPSGLSLMGMLFSFTSPVAHRRLAGMARRLGRTRLMAFSVGFTRMVVASDSDTAKEILSSPAFADRPVKESAYGLLFHRAMGFAPAGDYWRRLRRLSSTHLFNPRKIASFAAFRACVGEEMARDVDMEMGRNGEVEVRRILHSGSLNYVMKCVFGKRYDFEKDKEGVEVEGLVKEGYELLGTFNWSDHFPVLGWLDLQGVRRRCKSLVGRVNVFVGRIIEEHKGKRSAADARVGSDGDDEQELAADFVDVLLDLTDEEKLSESDMIAVLWEMIFRGTDTVAILLEWILARMVLHPEIQSKIQSEIDVVVGGAKQIEDSHVANLPYLQSVVKESLRMHPPGPLLSWARLAVHDVYVGESFVPAGTTAMVNMWAITHDHKNWKDPFEFRPERFMEEDVPIMGSDLRLAPFGSGRRVCPGKAMALATVHLWLAQLLQSFKWLPSEKGVDLSEFLKMSMEMEFPLVCVAVPRM